MKKDTHFLANKAYKNCEFEKAIEYYSILLNKEIQFEYYKKRGLSYFRINDYEEAIKDFTKYLMNSPDDYDIHYFRSVAFYRIQKYDQCIKDLDKSIKYKSNRSNFYYLRFLSKFRLNNINGINDPNDNSYQDYQKAVKIYPNIVNIFEDWGFKIEKAYNLNSIDGINIAIHDHPKELFLYTQRAKLFKQCNNYKGAIRDFKKALRISPDMQNVYKELGELYLNLDDYTNSKKYYNKSLSYDNSDYEIYYKLGTICSKLGEYENAIFYYEESSGWNPHYYQPILEEGKIKQLLGKFKESIEDFNICIVIDYSLAIFYIARAKSFLFINNFKGAIDDIKTYNELIGDDRKITYLLKSSNFEGISLNTNFDFQVQIYPDTPIEYEKRGKIRYHFNDLLGAFEDFNYALNKDKNKKFKYYNNIIKLYIELNDLNTALAYLESALERNVIDKVKYEKIGNEIMKSL